MYASHASEVPSEAARNTYREQIQRAYPFHPTTHRRLLHPLGQSSLIFSAPAAYYALLASIVGDLWKGRQGNTRTQHLIQPCDVRLVG